MKKSALILGLVSSILGRCLPVQGATDPVDPDRLSYNLKTTVEAYNQVGKTNALWDVDARKALTVFARTRAWTNSNAAAVNQELEPVLTRLSANKCDDPLIRYLHTRFVYAKAHSSSEFASTMREVAVGLEKSSYPDIRKFYANFWAARALMSVEPKRPEVTAGLALSATNLAKALDDRSMPLFEADQACEMLMSVTWWAQPGRWTAYCTLESALTNRWSGTSVALLNKGRAYLSHGWEARGIGYASKVTEEGWELLKTRLNVAAESLEAAWKVNPQDARICLEMMRVECGQAKGRDRLDLWFQRGMKLDSSSFDIPYAKLEYLRPRWYGTINDMIEFGRECTTNASFTGPARLMLAHAHQEAARESSDEAAFDAYWASSKVWADIKFTFDEFFKLYPDRVGYRHDLAKYAVQCQQWPEFLTQVKMFPTTNFAYFGGVDQFKEIVKTAEENATKTK